MNETNLLPFVKWAGGKRQIIEQISELIPDSFNTYIEPFVGGGALFFELQSKRAIINDYNKELISIYKCFKNKKLLNQMLEQCAIHEANHSEEYYYKIRDLDKTDDYKNMSSSFKAARCLYLNKACFNGLYRVNSQGFFNVPFGKKKKVKCFDSENMQNIFHYFHKSKISILSTDFENVLKKAKKNDFVYLDPPYDVVEKNSFTAYTNNSFNREAQIRLKNAVDVLTNKGVKVLLSNANTDFIRELYSHYNIHIIEAKRLINSNAEGRGNVQEVLITNY